MSVKTMLIAGLLAFSSSLWGQETVLLQELDVTKIRQDFGMPLVEGNVLELQAHSVLKMKLDGRVERFRTQIALDASGVAGAAVGGWYKAVVPSR